MAFGQPNYYQNPYVNNMYGQNYQPQNYGTNPYIPQQQVQPVVNNVAPTTLPQPTQNQQYPMIYGKIVENADMVRVNEIPIGGYGVFPLADSSKVYIKMYDKEGNPQTYLYELVKSKETKPAEDLYSDKLTEIYDYIAKIDKKMDSIKNASSPITTPVRKKKVEVNEEDE